MYDIEFTGKFKKDAKLCRKRGYDLSKLQNIIHELQATGKVSEQYSPHRLSGTLAKYWECHIGPDWLLLYDVRDTIKLVSLARTGTHSDIFK